MILATTMTKPAPQFPGYPPGKTAVGLSPAASLPATPPQLSSPAASAPAANPAKANKNTPMPVAALPGNIPLSTGKPDPVRTSSRIQNAPGMSSGTLLGLIKLGFNVAIGVGVSRLLHLPAALTIGMETGDGLLEGAFSQRAINSESGWAVGLRRWFNRRFGNGKDAETQANHRKFVTGISMMTGMAGGALVGLVYLIEKKFNSKPLEKLTSLCKYFPTSLDNKLVQGFNGYRQVIGKYPALLILTGLGFGAVNGFIQARTMLKLRHNDAAEYRQ